MTADPTITETLSLAEAGALGKAALLASGATEEVAALMSEALVEAEARGLAGVGLAHLLSYCEGLTAGRIDGRAEPVIEHPVPAIFTADAKGAVGHLAFDRCFEELVGTARTQGLVLFSQRGSFTNAALDWFVDRLARRGLVAIATTNAGPAFLAASGTTTPIFSTNPMAFGAPRNSTADGETPPLVIDQSSSATAYVNVRLAAERGEPIPESWALGPDGAPTTDPVAAMKGVLLAFGGARGANVALMVEVLSAGLSGGNWSLDAPSFLDGDTTPGIGLFVLAIDPKPILGDSFAERLDAYLSRISTEYGAHIPGLARAENHDRARTQGVTIPSALLNQLRAIAV